MTDETKSSPNAAESLPARARPVPGARGAAVPSPARETVTTIRADGSRAILFPADTKGRFTVARRISAYGLLAIYLLLPWIKINGYPAVFLDVTERRFHLFGITLPAQDLWLLFFVISGLGFGLFFVTALFGRVWCGWACPQTIFLEHVYRRIERWIDGDAVQRRALHHAPLSLAKAARRVAKHGVYILVSAVFTHLFLAYFVSVPEVLAMVRAAPAEHWGFFVFMAAYTGLTYFVFAWFREQLCIVICPYGRLQSALIDSHSLVIGYDATRGEPRGKASAVGTGACVDCHRCVQVCPTGIDIRQGLQMECIGCTACIDACDDVMTRLDRPRGLIRYDSQKGFGGGRTQWLRPRTFLYGALLAIGAAVAARALTTVKPASFGVTRMIGAPYIVDDASVRNQFLVRIVNKRSQPAEFSLRLVGAPAGVRQIGFEGVVEIAPLGELVRPLVLQQPRAGYAGPFHFEVRVADAAGDFQLQRQVEFLGPEARLLREDEARP
ncbi:MAG TPA: cytochrome c oxidase accessory protein CcoG [Opitutaceae bacterium]|nr:cytochrome c oxidase accessory protein CcoG [Opitutaceae bacterium]